MRPIKLGIKNWMIFGAESAGYNAAAIYTLVENCKAPDLLVVATSGRYSPNCRGVTGPKSRLR